MKATHLPKFLFTSALIFTVAFATSVFGQTRFEPSNQIQLLDSDGVAPDVGSFDELFNSIEKTEAPPLPQGALTLEGPANWQPTAPRQLNPQNYESMPSVLRADQAQLPADNPFLQLEDLPPTNAYPKQRIESQYAVPGTAPRISGSQSREFPQRVAPADLTPAIIAPSQTYDTNVAPSLTGPRPQIDQPVPYLDQPLPQRREIVPRVPVNPQYAQPATVWTRPTAPECPIERAARLRREAGYAGYLSLIHISEPTRPY